jgi:conjugal transfer pilus assembly protein TraU
MSCKTDPEAPGRGRRRAPWVCVLAAAAAIGLGALGLPAPARAACGADPANATILTALATICWDCLFPISLFSVPIDPGSAEAATAPAVGPGLPFPSPNPYPPPALCSCVCILPGVCLPGIPIGYWEPRHLIEVVHEPFCFPALGIDLSDAVMDFLIRGDQQTGHDEATDHQNAHYAHVHFIVFPALKVFSLLMDVLCLNAGAQTGELDLLYLSEIDPLWTADVLAALVFPETLLFANPIAGAACAGDAIAASLDAPLDPLFWCAGGWGQLYPPAGRQNNTSGGNLAVQPLLWARVLTKLARAGTEPWAAANGALLCQDLPTFVLVKSQYKWQLLDPVAYDAAKCCPKLGASQALWEWGKTIPVEGESHVWLLWRRQNCCML